MEVIVKDIKLKSGLVLSHWLVEALPSDIDSIYHRVSLRGFDGFSSLVSGKQSGSIIARYSKIDTRSHALSNLF